MFFILIYDMERATNLKIPLIILKDTENLFKVIVESSNTTEMRLTIDIQAAREALGKHEINNVSGSGLTAIRRMG